MSDAVETKNEAPTTGGAIEPAIPVYDRRDSNASNRLKRAIFSVPIEVVVAVGVARPLIGELMRMERDHILPLEAGVDDPVELRVRERVIARGQLVQNENGSGRLCVRVTEIVDMSEIV